MKKDRLTEFASIMNINKFYSKGNVLFSDNKPTFDYWKHNKNIILAGNDDTCLLIQKQYWLYKHMRLIEFSKERDFDKFNNSKSGPYFSNGSDMSKWFIKPENKDYIFNSDDKYSLKIQKDYWNYKNRKLIEFFKIEDQNKFYSKSGLRFKDGSDVYRWWVVNKNSIMDNDDEYSQIIKKQYEKYISKDFANKFYEFLLLEDAKKFKHSTKEEFHFKDGTSVYAWYSNHRDRVKRAVNVLIKKYEMSNTKVPRYLLNKVYLDEETIKKYKL